MTGLSASLKRRITNDWAAQFPAFSVREPMWLVRRVGPLVQGIYLKRNRGNDAYVPVLHISNLSVSRETLPLSMYTELRTATTLAPDVVRAAGHVERFENLVARLRQQSPLPLEGSISVDAALRAISQCMDAPHRYSPIHLREDILCLLNWCGRTDEARVELDRFERDLRSMRAEAPSSSAYQGVDEWAKWCLRNIFDRVQLEQVVECESKKFELGHISCIGTLTC